MTPTLEQRADLAWTELAGIIPLLEVCLAPRPVPGSGVRMPPKSKPPIDVGVSKMLEDIGREVDFYVKTLLAEDSRYKAPRRLDERIRSLVDRRGHFMGAEDKNGLDFVDCGETLVSRALGLITRPPPPRWRGPCRVGECHGQRYADADDVIRCDECGSLVDIRTWRVELARSLDSRLMRRDEIRDALKMVGATITPEKLRLWIHRGRLVPVIQEPELFRFTDALDLTNVKILSESA